MAIHAGKQLAAPEALPPLLDALLPLNWEEELPRGRIVAEVTLAEVLPMHADGQAPAPVVQLDGTSAWIRRPDGLNEHLDDQVPMGRFGPGRYAWRLTDPELVDDPTPRTGRQRLWRLEELS